MGTKAEELVRAGNHYIAIDLSSLDYIYSDSINRFINLNRAIIDINGRIVIVAPHPKVYELLEKAGVLNFIKVCRSREELLRVSEMISPSAPVAPAPVAPAPVAPAPVAPAPVAPAPVAPAPVAPAPVAPAPAKMSSPDVTQMISAVEDEFVPIEVSIENEISIDDKDEVEFDSSPAPIVAVASVQEPVHEERHSVAFETEAPVDDLYSDGDSFLERKKNLTPLLFTLVVLVALLAGGIFLFLSSLHSDPAVPAVSSESDVGIEETTVETVEPSTGKPTEAVAEAPVKKEKKKSKPVTESKKAAESASNDVITFTSTPSKVDVIVNGDYIGTTPYTWKKPKIYGDVEVVFRKTNYDDKVQRIEYTGGKKKLSATLTKMKSQSESAKASPENVQPKATDNSAAEKAAAARLASEKAAAEKSAAERLASEKAAADKSAADRIASEKAAAERAIADRLAAEKAASEKAAAKLASEKAAATQEASSAAATIFFNSLPPMADIYEDGKLVGKTNVKPVTTKSGAHTYEFKKDGLSAKYSATLHDGKNTAPMIRLQ